MIELAWPAGDRPGAIEFRHEPAAAIADIVIGAIGEVLPQASTGRLRSLQPGTAPVGRYSLEMPTQQYFLRVSARHGEPDLERSLVEWLEKAGVPVNPLMVAGLPLNWQGCPLRVDVRPFLSGRHFDGSPDDLAAVAQTLGRCHRALVDFPHAAKIKAHAIRRLESLAKARDRLARALDDPTGMSLGLPQEWIAKHEPWLRTMVAGFQATAASREGAQCVHGEIHQGNVILVGGDAVLVDFEEAVHTFAVPAWDQAYLVSRFCLHDNPDDSALAQRIAEAEYCYGRSFASIAQTLREISHTCMALLINAQPGDNIPVLLHEADKFIFLYSLAARIDDVAQDG